MIANRKIDCRHGRELRNFDIFAVALNHVASEAALRDLNDRMTERSHECIEAKPAVRKEAMRIAGKLVATDESVEVRNPYNGEVVGTVPAARPEHVREAFAKARAFKPKLTRYRAPAHPADARPSCCATARKSSRG